MVTGNHDGADAGAMRFGDGIAHSVRGGSMMPTMPTQIRSLSSTSLWSAMSATCPAALMRTPGTSASDAVPSGRYAWPNVRYASADSVPRRRDLLAIALRHRSYGTVDRDAATIAEQHVGGTLGEDGEATRIGVVLCDDGHAFAVRGEWNLTDARVVRVLAIGLHLACGDDKRYFGRITDSFPRGGGGCGSLSSINVFA